MDERDDYRGTTLPENYKQRLQRVANERKDALDEAVEAHLAVQEAKKRYSKAIMEADLLDCNISEIARRVGMSETSIRMFIKRQRANHG